MKIKKHNNHNNIGIENNYHSYLDKYYQLFLMKILGKLGSHVGILRFTNKII